MEKNIYLIGFMGSGKSSVAEELELHYGMKRIEMDQVLVVQNNMEISEIFRVHGEDYFRDLESDLLTKIGTEANQVISCGGGIILRKKNVDMMKQNGIIILLAARPETVLSRVKDDDARPVLQGKKTVQGIAELMESRRAKYEEAADVTIHTDRKSIAEICKEIQQKLTKIGE